MLLTINRNRVAFFVSLIMLSVAMILWRDMFLFAKSAPVPKWSYFLPYPFILTSDIVFVCLLPVAFLVNRFRFACASVMMCVLLSPLVSVITWMTTISYTPLLNGIYNYLFIILFHCVFPAFLVLIIRAIINFIQKYYS